jgi:hexokinase
MFFQDIRNIEVAGILNDAVGTLMCCAHKKESCRIGVIVGKSKNSFEYHMDSNKCE